MKFVNAVDNVNIIHNTHEFHKQYKTHVYTSYLYFYVISNILYSRKYFLNRV